MLDLAFFVSIQLAVFDRNANPESFWRLWDASGALFAIEGGGDLWTFPAGGGGPREKNILSEP